MNTYKWLAAPLALLALLALSSCAPATTLQPEEVVVPVSFEDAFQITSRAINTQPYPSNKGAWIITQSDQVGGFISAEMTYMTRVWLTFLSDPVQITERVSVALNERGEDQTAVNVSGTSGEEAVKLAEAIIRALNEG